MKSLIAVLSLGVLAVSAQAQTSPVGLWRTIDDKTKTEKALVRINEANGVLSGKIEKLLAPDAKPDATCTKCTDDRKDKPLVGLEIIRNVRKDGETWAGGTILDAAEGDNYKVKLTQGDGGKKLEVRAYIGAPLFGRTQTWHRVE